VAQSCQTKNTEKFSYNFYKECFDELLFPLSLLTHPLLSTSLPNTSIIVLAKDHFKEPLKSAQITEAHYLNPASI
jgi:hypothetical protein